MQKAYTKDEQNKVLQEYKKHVLTTTVHRQISTTDKKTDNYFYLVLFKDNKTYTLKYSQKWKLIATLIIVDMYPNAIKAELLLLNNLSLREIISYNINDSKKIWRTSSYPN